MIVNKGGFQTKGMGGWLDDLLGPTNAANLEAAIKGAATTAATNVIGNTIQNNPNAAAAIQNTLGQTGTNTFAQIWNQYKMPIMIVSGLLAVGVSIGVYNTLKKK